MEYKCPYEQLIFLLTILSQISVVVLQLATSGFFPSKPLPPKATCSFSFCLSHSFLLNPDGIRKLLPKWVSSTQWVQQMLKEIIYMWCLHLKISFNVRACGSSGRRHSREQWWGWGSVCSPKLFWPELDGPWIKCQLRSLSSKEHWIVEMN